MNVSSGQKVIVLEHWRAHGKIGGWEDWEQLGEILKVNRRTVKYQRILPHGRGAIYTTSIERVLRMA